MNVGTMLRKYLTKKNNTFINRYKGQETEESYHRQNTERKTARKRCFAYFF